MIKYKRKPDESDNRFYTHSAFDLDLKDYRFVSEDFSEKQFFLGDELILEAKQ